MACVSVAARRSSFVLPGLPLSLKTSWTRKHPDSPSGHAFTVRNKKWEQYLCPSSMLKPFLGYAPRGGSSHTYKIPCRIWWKLKERIEVVLGRRSGDVEWQMPWDLRPKQHACLLLLHKNLCLELWGWLVGKETRKNGLKKCFAKVHSLLLFGLFLKQPFFGFFKCILYSNSKRQYL